MATLPTALEVYLAPDTSELLKELEAARDALSEERIRAIVREEIRAYLAANKGDTAK